MTREYWANVYGPGWHLVAIHKSRERAVADASRSIVSRVHVRLKPEGAPRRYRSEANRRAWEEMPAMCRHMVGSRNIPAEVIV